MPSEALTAFLKQLSAVKAAQQDARSVDALFRELAATADRSAQNADAIVRPAAGDDVPEPQADLVTLIGTAPPQIG